MGNGRVWTTGCFAQVVHTAPACVYMRWFGGWLAPIACSSKAKRTVRPLPRPCHVMALVQVTVRNIRSGSQPWWAMLEVRYNNSKAVGGGWVGGSQQCSAGARKLEGGMAREKACRAGGSRLLRHFLCCAGGCCSLGRNSIHKPAH